MVFERNQNACARIGEGTSAQQDIATQDLLKRSMVPVQLIHSELAWSLKASVCLDACVAEGQSSQTSKYTGLFGCQCKCDMLTFQPVGKSTPNEAASAEGLPGDSLGRVPILSHTF